MNIDARDLKIHYYKSSGPGGQRKNKRETAVRIAHIPTGLVAIATESRSQFQNKEIALHRLKEKISRLTRKQKKRISTVLPLSVKEEVLEKKRKRSKKKKQRSKNINYIFKEYV